MIKNEDDEIKTKCCNATSITVYNKLYVKQYSYCKKCGKIYYRVPEEKIKKEQEKKIKESKKREADLQRRMREFEMGINRLAESELESEWEMGGDGGGDASDAMGYVIRPVVDERITYHSMSRGVGVGV